MARESRKEIAREIREIFNVSARMKAVPIIKGTQLADEEMCAMECAFSTALEVAALVAEGKTDKMSPTERAIRMKVTAIQTYVNDVVLAGEEGEAKHE